MTRKPVPSFKARVLALEPHAEPVMRVDPARPLWNQWRIVHKLTGAPLGGDPDDGWRTMPLSAWEAAFVELSRRRPPDDDLAAVGRAFLSPRDARPILDRLNGGRRAGELFGLEPQRDGRLILSRYVLPEFHALEIARGDKP